MSDKPKIPVSVIIPCWNRRTLIGEALKSIDDQTVAVAEIIVVDDGSTDGSVSYVKEQWPQVMLVECPHRGLPATRNTGLLKASQPFIAFLDSDDLFLPEKLEKQIQYLADNPATECVFTMTQAFDHDTGRSIGSPKPGTGATTLLMRQELVTRTGLFDESTSIGEFIEWFGRAELAGTTSYCLPELLHRRRSHAHNMTRENRKDQKAYVDIARQMILRRKAAAKAMQDS